MLYSELHCSEAIHKAVEQMGFAEMTEIQEKTIPVMLAGRDVIAKAPTGTGKTCAFGIPVAEQIDPAQKVPQAVILAPTRELAQQIADELTALTAFMPGVAVACVYGGANMEKQARRLAEGCQIVVATPGRLMDHYKHHSIDLSHVTQIVLDEADEMLNMGFYKDVRHIIELMKSRKHLSMFSATISREVMDIGWLYQHNAEEITVQPKEESQPKITQYMLETSGRNKLSDLAQIIIGEGYKRVMVFCDTSSTRPRWPTSWPASASRWTASTATSPRKSATRSCRTSGTANWPSSWPPTWRPAASTSRMWTPSSTTTSPATMNITPTASAAPAAPKKRASATCSMCRRKRSGCRSFSA